MTTLSFLLNVTGVKVITKNVCQGCSVTAASESNTVVTVSLSGVASVIQGINSDDIIAYIDLTGLDSGTHDVEVQIEKSDSRVDYLSKTKKII